MNSSFTEKVGSSLNLY